MMLLFPNLKPNRKQGNWSIIKANLSDIQAYWSDTESNQSTIQSFTTFSLNTPYSQMAANLGRARG